jgi:large subunit ribosomal protein L9
MELLLKEDIEKLGQRGDIVNVAPGYARNFLIPRGLAAPATDENRRQIEAQRKSEEKQLAEARKEMADAARQIEQTSCTISAPASPEGHLFGSVGPEQIAAAFKADDLPVEPKQVLLDEPIREVGVFLAKIKITGDLAVTIRVWVTAE